MAVGDRAERGLVEGPLDAESGASARGDPLLGAVINGKFRILEAIARGGMGRIYYAMQQPLERPVALKVVQGDGDNERQSQFLKRFLQEASILAKLQHPNVVTLYDYGRIEGVPFEQYFIAMEYLNGETLTARLKSRRWLDVRETLVLGRQMARGLREAHTRGIVHRDLKPSNVLLVPESDGGEIVKIVDFGIGKVVERADDAQDLTQDGFLVGTPRFMAPEQFEGHAFPASDLYALGTILYLCVTGRLPYGGANVAELMVAKMAPQPIPPMRDMNPEAQVPESFERLCRALLARNPNERPTPEQLFAMLTAVEDEVFGGSSPSVRRPHGLFTSPPSGVGVPVQSHPSGAGVPYLINAPSSPSNDRLTTGERLRVPHTMVASMASLTPRPMEAPASAPAAPRKSSAALVVAILGPLLIAAAVGGWLLVARARAQAHAAAASSSTASSATSAAPSAEPPGEPASFTLVIDSSPSGATVHEGDGVLGTTPLTLTVDRASAAAHPRTFVLKKDGFADSTLVQGPANDTVRSTVTLSPEPHAVPKPRAGKGPTPPRATAAPSPSGLDIRIKR